MEEGEDKFFVTSNFALTGYLELQGLKYLKAGRSQDRKGNINVEFTFFDPEDKGRDLEIEFRHSRESKYRDNLFYYRKVINDLMGR